MGSERGILNTPGITVNTDAGGPITREMMLEAIEAVREMSDRYWAEPPPRIQPRLPGGSWYTP